MQQRTLPDYDNPPAQETWMAFRFSSLDWRIPHFGAFWNEVKDDYPDFEVHPPLGDFALQLTNKDLDATISLPIRCWFINNEQNRLLQVQHNRFFQNWRRPNPAAPYLHYEKLRPSFEYEWSRFCDFARRHRIGTPAVLLCEVCYINHLERGIGWKDYADLAVIFPSIGTLHGRQFLKLPETTAVSASFVIPPNEGRLQVAIHPAVRQSDGKEVIQLTITAGCRPASNDMPELLRCLDDCRYWVVTGFDDLTSDDMHRIWRKK